MKRQNPLQVLWLAPAYPSVSDPIGGIFHKTEVNALERMGAEIRVIAPVPWVPPMMDSFRAKWQQYKHTPEQYMDGGVTIHRPRYLAIPKANHLAMPDHLLIRNKILRMDLPKPDLIHAHFSFPLGLSAVHLSRIWGVPSVLTLHGSDVNVYPEINRMTCRRFCAAVTGATSVLAVSQALSDRTKVVSGVRPIVKPVGINLKAYRSLPSKREARLQLGLPQDAFLVLYIGYLLETKGIRELLKALEELHSGDSSIMGVFVGGGELEDEVKQTPHMVSAGVQPNTRIPLYLAAADLLVLPSYREGLPTVLVEAGAAGTPVIATNVGGIPELLGEGRGSMIPAKSVKELKQAIKDVRIKRTDAAGRAQRLKDYVFEHYDADSNAEKLIRLYEGLVAKVPQAVE
ncbi:glycosyltransferase [Paenibacillus agricola]|uniref:Glycosyltransferase family 4 protein n=1 Tax=Paenibacillus agricola TaxID=2716264 RepID=A0ABX0J5M9_9BACL|nr:glycosyltransferase [Paenibacillus agricola]NHN29396.1 glycosyltransferase family 4 protein [Paenibacillus agricola]